MKRIYSYALALALISGSAMYGSAQTAYGHPYQGNCANGFFDRDDYGNRGWHDAQRMAEQYGYQDGLNDGTGDFNNHHSFRPTHGGNYKHADRGYDRRFGDKDRYRDAYRRAYARGYQEGYNTSDRRYDHDHDHHDHDRDDYDRH